MEESSGQGMGRMIAKCPALHRPFSPFFLIFLIAAQAAFSAIFCKMTLKNKIEKESKLPLFHF